jgi:hypothetical protein
MKKNIFKILIIAVSFFLLNACSDDFLETTDLDLYSEDLVWNDATLAQAFVYNSSYDIVRYFLSTASENTSYLGEGGDDFTDNIASWKTTEAFTVGKSTIDEYYDAGWSEFDLIREANIIIQYSEASTSFTDAQKESFKAQGCMLRAMVYYKQARLFGKYILIDEVLTTSDTLNLARSSTIKETYDFILEDLDYAAEYLPEDADNGELTKGLALAMKAEVALHGAAYIESGSEDYYEQSVAASEALFALGKYSIDTDYESLFNDYSYAESSSEIIFAYWESSVTTLFKNTPMQRMVPNCETDQLDAAAVPQLVENFVGWPVRVPSWDLTTDYLVTDEDGVAKKYDETSYYQDWVADGGYVSSFLFKNRDSRFDASIARDSTYLFANLITTRDGGNCDRAMLLKGSTNATRSGFWMRKGVYEQVALYSKSATNYHYCISRLGRSYLNYAEALLRLNRTSEAVAAMNVTRTNHGDLPALSTGISEEDAWTYYKIERRVELFYECGDRYWSLLRWAKADGDSDIAELDHGVKYMQISSDGKDYEIQETFQDADNNILSWDEKRFLFPVPQTQIELNENLDQNPGW